MSEQISVAMAVYNGGRYLREQLDSVFAQTWSNLELVVVDDQSSDNSAAILAEYAARSPNMRYVRNDSRLGLVKNFEKAILLCRGVFIALADQDDVWLPDKVERLFEKIGDSDLVCSDARLIDANGTEIASSMRAYTQIPILPGHPFRELCFFNFVTGCTAMFRRSLLSRAMPFPDGVLYHDWWLAMVASTAGGIACVDESLVLYRQHDANLAGTARFRGWRSLLRLDIVSLRKKMNRRYAANLRAMMTSPCFTLEQQNILSEAHACFRSGTISRAIKVWHNRALLFPTSASWLRGLKSLFSILSLGVV